MKEWRDCTLGDLLEIKHGYAFLGAYFGDSGTHIVLTPGNFYDEGGFKGKGQSEKWYSGPIPSGYVLKEGDVVIAMTEQAEGLLGSSAIVPRSDLYLHNQRLGLVKLLDPSKTDLRFVYYLFNAKPVRQQIRASASGAKIRHTAPSRIANVRVQIPPFSVQKRVAEILSTYDELIANNQRRIRILEDMARALYREWFVEFRFPGHEKVQRIASPIGDIPKGWQVRPFAALGSYVNGYAFKPDDWGAEGKPIVKIKELKAGVAADTPHNSGDGIPEKYIVRDGDVLFSWSADLDVYLWMGGEALLNQHLFNVVPADGLSRAFCFYALKESMPRFRALSLGATMHHIKRSALDQVFSAHPPEGLRERFDLIVEPMHQQLVTLTKRIQNLRRTRDLLLPRLVEGPLSKATAEGRPRTASARR